MPYVTREKASSLSEFSRKNTKWLGECLQVEKSQENCQENWLEAEATYVTRNGCAIELLLLQPIAAREVANLIARGCTASQRVSFHIERWPLACARCAIIPRSRRSKGVASRARAARSSHAAAAPREWRVGPRTVIRRASLALTLDLVTMPIVALLCHIVALQKECHLTLRSRLSARALVHIFPVRPTDITRRRVRDVVIEPLHECRAIECVLPLG